MFLAINLNVTLLYVLHCLKVNVGVSVDAFVPVYLRLLSSFLSGVVQTTF